MEEMTTATEQRVPLAEAQARAQELVALMEPHVVRVQVAGSVRRGRPDVGDIDLVCQLGSSVPEPLVQLLDEAGALFSSVAPKTWVFAWHGMKVEVYLAEEETFAMTLLWRTGSAAHNIRLACRAKTLGLLIRKDGVLHEETGERLACRSLARRRGTDGEGG